jgi:hypothetical protein
MSEQIKLLTEKLQRIRKAEDETKKELARLINNKIDYENKVTIKETPAGRRGF